MKTFLLLLTATALLVVFTGCETLGGSADDPSPASASAIPWNKPASWEGAGALGGLGFQGTH